jgi:cytochrome d ubiquinol oxidase subunit II
METLWYFIVAVMFAVYVVLDGFDFGAGIVQHFVARTESERRELRAAIGPFWDGNEVWLLAGGGALFMAFPRVYAVGFSGFYLPLMLVLWLLVLRGLAMELRTHHQSPLWSQFWDATLTLASVLLAVVLGAALGNVVRGVPIDASGYFQMGLFSREPGELGVLDGYTVLIGVLALLILSLHGALYLTWKCSGPLLERSRRVSWIALWLATPVAGLATWATVRVRPEFFPALFARVSVWPLVPFFAALLLVAMRLKRPREAFICSCLLIAGLLAGAAGGLFPVLLRSTVDPALSLDAFNSAAAPHGLRVALVWWCIGLPLVCGYFAVLFRLFRGKVELDEETHY